MRTAEEKNKLFRKIGEKRREISQLQSELNSINDKKEASFQKKTELSNKISSLIDEIKKSRKERNSFTGQVKQDKVEREKRNKEVRQAVEKIKDIEKQRDELLRKHNIQGNPTSIMRQISALEFKIETEPMSFDKEKKIMKQIKDLKKKMDQSKVVSDVLGKIHALSEEIDMKKKVAQETHKKVQNHAKKSQEKHETLIEASSEIDAIKEEEEKTFKDFIEQKKRFNEVNVALNKKLEELNELSSREEDSKKSAKRISEKKKKEQLEQKKLSVEEKMRKGMKLTTEDLLAFQGTDME